MRWNGKAMRKARRSAGLSQGNLAERLGVSRPTISHWERKGCPDVETAIRIAEALAVQLSDFLSENLTD